MRTAYKTLDAEGNAPVTGWQWPLPKNGRRGRWVKVTGKPELCKHGFHAFPSLEEAFGRFKADDVIYEVELDGDIVEGQGKLAANRARLVRAVPMDELQALRDKRAAAAQEAERRKEADDLREVLAELVDAHEKSKFNQNGQTSMREDSAIGSARYLLGLPQPCPTCRRQREVVAA